MGLNDYDEAVRLIAECPDLLDFVGPRDELLVQAAERALGVKFPATYRRFLLEHGAGGLGASEIYGVIDDDFVNSSVPDAVWYTLTEREGGGFPDNLVAIYSDGMGGLFCLECSDKTDTPAPVVAYYPGLPMELQPSEIIAGDFGEFFLELVRRELSREW